MLERVEGFFHVYFLSMKGGEECSQRKDGPILKTEIEKKEKKEKKENKGMIEVMRDS